MTRTLRIERLADLAPDDLAAVSGGAPTYNCQISEGQQVCVPRTLGRECLLTGVYPTDGCA